MTTIESHKEHIRNLQYDNIQKTRDILKIIDESNNAGAKSLELLDKQYEQLQKINKNTDNINHNLETSSSILGKIKYFFFPRKVTKIDKFSKELTDDVPENNITVPEINDDNISKRKNECVKFVDRDLEDELDNNFDDIGTGVATLKNIALTMTYSLDRDKELLDKVNLKSDIVNSNMKKINKEITKIL